MHPAAVGAAPIPFVDGAAQHREIEVAVAEGFARVIEKTAFIASAASIARAPARNVLVECEEKRQLIDPDAVVGAVNLGNVDLLDDPSPKAVQ